MLVVDFMHECELGTWKALFTHLVRILYALPGGVQLVATLDSRWVRVCTARQPLGSYPTTDFARSRRSVME